MKRIKMTIWLCCLIVIGSNVVAKDNVKQKVKSVANLEIKCHIELLGGGDIIHFAKISDEQLPMIKQLLEGTTVPTALSKKKRVIYKVNECVGLHDNFVTGPAKSKDILTVR